MKETMCKTQSVGNSPPQRLRWQKESLIFQHLVSHASLNHVARWTMWYMICTLGYDLELCGLALMLKLTSKLAMLWLAGLSQMSLDNPTSLNSVSPHVNSDSTNLSPEFRNISQEIRYAVLPLPSHNANANCSQHCLVQACSTVNPYYFPRLTFESHGLQKMLSKFLYPQKEGKRSHLLLSGHNPLIYFF